jgi:hypothetical protein
MPEVWLTSLDDAWRQWGPTSRALRAFGVRDGSLRPLAGGQGNVWADDRVVVKPLGFWPEHDWVCGVYADWRSPDVVRVPEPIAPRATTGSPVWSVDGWGAHVLVPGRDLDLPREIDLVREASDAFHSLVRDLPRPGFLDDREDPWAFGDRLAWEGIEPEGDTETLGVIARLRAELRPVASESQVIHGDILPNVLIAQGRPPAVIDWPPYYRPGPFANAVAVTDAVTFRGAPLELLDLWATGRDWDQLLLRALLYRLGPTGIFTVRNRLMGSLVTHVERVRPVVDAVVARLQT